MIDLRIKNTYFLHCTESLNLWFSANSTISKTLMLISAFLKWNDAISNAGNPISRLRKSWKIELKLRKVPFYNKENIVKIPYQNKEAPFKIAESTFERGLERNGKTNRWKFIKLYKWISNKCYNNACHDYIWHSCNFKK